MSGLEFKYQRLYDHSRIATPTSEQIEKVRLEAARFEIKSAEGNITEAKVVFNTLAKILDIQE